MAQFVIANNVNTQLASALPSSGAGSTTVVLASSANLPTLNTSIGQMMPLTLNDAATGAIYETMYVTAISGSTLTVLRGQEGTSALNWNVGDLAFCGPTAGTVGLTTMRTQYQASASFSSSQTLTAAIAGESVGFTGTSASVFSMPGQSTVPNLTPTAVYNDGTATLTLTANGSDKFVVATGQVTSIVMQPGDDLTFYASTTANLWTTASGSALRQYEPLVVGAATASQHAVQLQQTFGHQVLITASGNQTIPNGVTSIFVSMVSGGSGGGGSGSAITSGTNSSASGGGGGGGTGVPIYKQQVTVVPGQVLTATIGAPGTGGVASTGSGVNAGAGSTGGTTSLTGSSPMVNVSVAGVAGGAPSANSGNGQVTLGGTSGSSNSAGGGQVGIFSATPSIGIGGIGGNGSATIFGPGGASQAPGGGTSNGVAGKNGTGFGSGGSGGTGASVLNGVGASVGAAGGNGIAGAILIEW